LALTNTDSDVAVSVITKTILVTFFAASVHDGSVAASLPFLQYRREVVTFFDLVTLVLHRSVCQSVLARQNEAGSSLDTIFMLINADRRDLALATRSRPGFLTDTFSTFILHLQKT
jgi:hypothetical protein